MRKMLGGEREMLDREKEKESAEFPNWKHRGYYHVHTVPYADYHLG